jgi:hydroxymethylpyrimidine/phosphomethylpyrimidine kinase
MAEKKPVIAAVGGFDPSGGAGILADIKTISAFGCYGVAAITSLTVQNTKGILAAHHQPEAVVYAQIKALLDDFEISAFKTGMLPSAEIIGAVTAALNGYPNTYLVVDPVLWSSTGFDLADHSTASLIECMFPMASLVTPNAKEAARITGIEVADEESMESAGRKILTMGPSAVLIKGGDRAGQDATDILIDSEGVVSLSSPKIQSRNTHGTGCTLASAIAAGLALGKPLREAVRNAKDYVSAAIRSASGLGHGFGPLNHFPPVQ